eukprot:tig00000142_g8664.t1
MRAQFPTYFEPHGDYYAPFPTLADALTVRMTALERLILESHLPPPFDDEFAPYPTATPPALDRDIALEMRVTALANAIHIAAAGARIYFHSKPRELERNHSWRSPWLRCSDPFSAKPNRLLWPTSPDFYFTMGVEMVEYITRVLNLPFGGHFANSPNSWLATVDRYLDRTQTPPEQGTLDVPRKPFELHGVLLDEYKLAVIECNERRLDYSEDPLSPLWRGLQAFRTGAENSGNVFVTHLSARTALGRARELGDVAAFRQALRLHLDRYPERVHERVGARSYPSSFELSRVEPGPDLQLSLVEGYPEGPYTIRIQHQEAVLLSNPTLWHATVLDALYWALKRKYNGDKWTDAEDWQAQCLAYGMTNRLRLIDSQPNTLVRLSLVRAIMYGADKILGIFQYWNKSKENLLADLTPCVPNDYVNPSTATIDIMQAYNVPFPPIRQRITEYGLNWDTRFLLRWAELTTLRIHDSMFFTADDETTLRSHPLMFSGRKRPPPAPVQQPRSTTSGSTAKRVGLKKGRKTVISEDEAGDDWFYETVDLSRNARAIFGTRYYYKFFGADIIENGYVTDKFERVGWWGDPRNASTASNHTQVRGLDDSVDTQWAFEAGHSGLQHGRGQHNDFRLFTLSYHKDLPALERLEDPTIPEDSTVQLYDVTRSDTRNEVYTINKQPLAFRGVEFFLSTLSSAMAENMRYTPWSAVLVAEMCSASQPRSSFTRDLTALEEYVNTKPEWEHPLAESQIQYFMHGDTNMDKFMRKLPEFRPIHALNQLRWRGALQALDGVVRHRARNRSNPYLHGVQTVTDDGNTARTVARSSLPP